MIGFTLRRLLLLLPVFFVVSLVVFFIIHLVPGDPIDNLMRAGSSPEQRLQIAAKYGLDRSLVEQYFTWMGRLLTGDLGTSIVQGRPVSGLIAQNLPYSLQLGGAALLFSTLTGIAAGVIALINSIGNLGGFVAPTTFGYLEQRTGSIQGGLMGLAITSLVAAGVVFLARSGPGTQR